MATRIKLRKGLASQWSSINPILAEGEMGIELDTRKFKFGDGITTWNSLDYSVDKNQIGLSNVDNTSDLDKEISNATQSALDLKADISSVYTIEEVDSIVSNSLNTSNSYTDSKVAAIVNSAPATLDTLNELATALGNDPNFATTTATLIGTKADASSVYTKTQSDANYEPKNANIQSHISSSSNPHNVSKAQVGLGLVDNTSDLDKPISLQTQDALDLKVDFILGKQLSENDFTNAYKTKIDGIQAGATANDTNANLRDRSTHTGNESTLTFSEVATPSAPASGLTIYAESNGKQMLGQVPKVGRAYPFQPHLGQSNIMMWAANANATTSSVYGQPAPTASGTATARTIATTNTFTWQRRVGYTTTPAINQSAGLRSTVLQVGLSNTANTGGFFFQTRFGVSDPATTSVPRCFVGLSSTTAVFGNADPSSILNMIGIGHDVTDVTFQLMHNDGTGLATKINLGASFPISSVSLDMIDLILYAAPNSTSVFYQVINLRNNATASGTLTTNLPAVNQLLTWQIWRNTGTGTLAVGIDIASVYLETEF